METMTATTPMRNKAIEKMLEKEMEKRRIAIAVAPFIKEYNREREARKAARPPAPGKTDLSQLFVPVITLHENRRLFSDVLVRRIDRKKALSHPYYGPRVVPYWTEV